MANRPYTIACIPARGASKRVPGKNIKLLHERPLIQYTIDAARNSLLVDEVIVSTDDDQIAKTADDLGARVPFMRPDEFASDRATDYDVIRHLLDWKKDRGEKMPELIAYLRPTSPFKTAAMIDACIEQISTTPEVTCLRTVTRSEGVHHPYWMFRAEETLQPFIEGISIKEYYQSQLLPDCYRLNGVVDILKSSYIMEHRDVYGDRMGYYILNEMESFDIDTQFDFELCEFLMARDGQSNS